MFLNKIRSNTSSQPSEKDLYTRMRLAIERVEAAFEPKLRILGAAQARKLELDKLELRSLADIARWERGWLELISEVTHVR